MAKNKHYTTRKYFDEYYKEFGKQLKEGTDLIKSEEFTPKQFKEMMKFMDHDINPKDMAKFIVGKALRSDIDPTKAVKTITKIEDGKEIITNLTHTNDKRGMMAGSRGYFAAQVEAKMSEYKTADDVPIYFRELWGQDAATLEHAFMVDTNFYLWAVQQLTSEFGDDIWGGDSLQ